jgi:cell wall-associated NlpC family hydrolase
MTTITRNEFIANMRSKEIDLNKLPSADRKMLRGADVNGDRFVRGNNEMSQAFKAIDSKDRNGSMNSVNTNNREVARSLANIESASRPARGLGGRGGSGSGSASGSGDVGAAGNAGNAPRVSGSGVGARALSAAKSQIGVREATGNNDGIPAQRYSGGRKEPWCANFVGWAYKQSGKQLPGGGSPSVQIMEDKMKNAGQWARRGARQPQPGDVIFFANRGGTDRGNGRHVGIVSHVSGGQVFTVEGNAGNAVATRSYALNNPRITGYGWN